LLARVRAQLRRRGKDWDAPAPSESTLTLGPLEINLREHAATVNGRPVKLTVTEFRMLHYLMRNAGTVVPSRTILKHVWGSGDLVNVDLVRVTLHRLRRKLEDDPSNPQLLHTVSGVGVMLKPQEAPPEQVAVATAPSEVAGLA
jgi:DNA-binding response OmpR family regulator